MSLNRVSGLFFSDGDNRFAQTEGITGRPISSLARVKIDKQTPEAAAEAPCFLNQISTDLLCSYCRFY